MRERKRGGKERKRKKEKRIAKIEQEIGHKKYWQGNASFFLAGFIELDRKLTSTSFKASGTNAVVLARDFGLDY